MMGRYLAASTALKCKYLAGYATLLQAWIDHHLKGIGREEDDEYEEHLPRARKFGLTRGQTNANAVRKTIDRLLQYDD
ncbi:hypothetical protein A2U01_0044328, partial [Trifolium medium]|nr:hypothetical protein [Trifolium medium]